jgi:hypothetical protein
MQQTPGDIHPCGRVDEVCFFFLTHNQLDLSSEFFKIHRIAANKIQYFGTGMSMPVIYHFIGSIYGAKDLCKRLIPLFYGSFLPDPYVYWRLRIRLARYSPRFF